MTSVDILDRSGIKTRDWQYSLYRKLLSALSFVRDKKKKTRRKRLCNSLASYGTYQYDYEAMHNNITKDVAAFLRRLDFWTGQNAESKRNHNN